MTVSVALVVNSGGGTRIRGHALGAAKLALCLLTLTVAACFWREALVMAVGVIGAFIALAVLDALGAMVTARPLLAATLFLLWTGSNPESDE